MDSIFSYDSKLMQLLMFIGDLIILNVLYIVCCIPIFTIGAAQAGMYSAMKVLLDQEDDTSPRKAFFKGFRTGFGTVTLGWGLMTLLMIFVAAMGLGAMAYGCPGWIVVVDLCIIAIFQCLVPLFHFRFGCTAMQLIRNAWFMVIAHPIRSIAVAAMIWLPVVVFLVDMYSFMAMIPVWLLLYFSIACMFGYSFSRKPFDVLVENFNETHGNETTEELIAELKTTETEKDTSPMISEL